MPSMPSSILSSAGEPSFLNMECNTPTSVTVHVSRRSIRFVKTVIYCHLLHHCSWKNAMIKAYDLAMMSMLTSFRSKALPGSICGC